MPVDVNFGNLPLDPLIEKKKPQTWPAIVHGWKRLPKSWQWSKTNRLTFICHSQGGTTVRYLLHLLSGRAPSDLPQFPRNDEQARVKAVTTLGTPHKGTTLTDVAEVRMNNIVRCPLCELPSNQGPVFPARRPQYKPKRHSRPHHLLLLRRPQRTHLRPRPRPLGLHPLRPRNLPGHASTHHASRHCLVALQSERHL